MKCDKGNAFMRYAAADLAKRNAAWGAFDVPAIRCAPIEDVRENSYLDFDAYSHIIMPAKALGVVAAHYIAASAWIDLSTAQAWNSGDVLSFDPIGLRQM